MEPQKAYPLKPSSPLVLIASVWALGLFEAWERALILFFISWLYLLKRKTYLLALILLVAFLYGTVVFPPPKIDNQRLKTTSYVRIDGPLLNYEFYRKGRGLLLDRQERTLLYFSPKGPLSPGDTFSATLSLKRPRSFLNPFAQDFARHRMASGLKWVGNVREIKDLKHQDKAFLPKLRQKLFSFAQSLSPRGRMLFEALVLGEKGHLLPTFKHRFERLGLFHLLAISGLHLGLLLGWCYFLIRGAFFLWPRPLNYLTDKQWLFLLGSPVLLVYALVSGPSPSALRALIMFMGWGVALFFFRGLAGFDLLALAVLFITAIWPQAVGTFSFRLSVSAVLALILVNRLLNRLPAPQNKILGYLFKIFCFSLGATLATIPWLLSLKGSFSPWAPLSNMLALPLFTFLVLPLFLVAGALSFATPTLAAGLAETATRLLWLPPWTLPEIRTPLPVGVFILLWALPALGYFIKQRLGLLVGLLLAIFLGLGLYSWYGKMRLVLLLDVGEGSACVVKGQGKEAFLLDTGPRRGEFDAGEFILVPSLKKLGLRPKVAVISHFESDHAGGLLAVKRAWPKIKVIGPESFPKVYRENGLSFLFLGEGTFPSANDNSLVTRLSLGGLSFLFPGDIGRKRELKLLNAPVSAEVLLLPHHGAKSSSSFPFLKKVAPKIALSSARRAHHPAQETLKRLEALGIRHFSTKEHGAISLIFDHGSWWLCLEDERRSLPLLWRALWPFVKAGCHPLLLANKGPY